MVQALVIVDMHRGYMKDVDNPEEIIQNQINLIKTFKTHKLKVILFVINPQKTAENPVMYRLWGEEFKNDPEALEVVKELAELDYDKIVEKSEYSIFYRTDLEKYCGEQDIDELYFAGVFGGCCIFFSAADAAYRRIQPYLVTDAVGDPRESKDETHRRFELLIGPLITTKELIKKIDNI